MKQLIAITLSIVFLTVTAGAFAASNPLIKPQIAGTPEMGQKAQKVQKAQKAQKVQTARTKLNEPGHPTRSGCPSGTYCPPQ